MTHSIAELKAENEELQKFKRMYNRLKSNLREEVRKEILIQENAMMQSLSQKIEQSVTGCTEIVYNAWAYKAKEPTILICKNASPEQKCDFHKGMLKVKEWIDAQRS